MSTLDTNEIYEDDGELVRAIKLIDRRKEAVSDSPVHTREEAQRLWIGFDIDIDEVFEVEPAIEKVANSAILMASMARDETQVMRVIEKVVFGFFLDGLAVGLMMADQRQQRQKEDG